MNRALGFNLVMATVDAGLAAHRFGEGRRRTAAILVAMTAFHSLIFLALAIVEFGRWNNV